MERIYYSRQNYNQLKKKQHEEYIERQNTYYIYIKRYYEEYVKNQNNYYLDKRKYYEEYVKRQNTYYVYIKRYYEEYVKNQNNYYLDKKRYYEEYVKKQNKYYIYIKRYYKEYVKNQNNYYLDKKRYYEEYIKRQNKYHIYIKRYYEEYIKNQNNYYLDKKKYDEEHHRKYNDVFANKRKYDKTDTLQSEFLNSCSRGEKDEELLGENDKEYIGENGEDILEENNKEYLEKKYEAFLEESDEKFLEEDYKTVAKKEISKKMNISTVGIYVNLPVILAEANITISLEAIITLDQPVIEIKGIKKNLFLTQSHLIPFSSSSVDPNSGILFIAGFIRNNIEYKTQTCTTARTTNVCENIRHCIVEVPFNFTTRITFLKFPIFIEKSTTREVEFLTNRPEVGDICTNPVIGRNPCEQSFRFTEVFNEKPFVELVKATFSEVDIHKNPILSHETPEEGMFNQITEKIIVNVTLKVLQEQLVKVAIE